MRLTTRKEIFSLRRRRLSTAAANHYFAVDQYIGDARQITVGDRVGNTSAGGPLNRPANNDVGRASGREKPPALTND